jgi:hypothetical protein
VVDTGHTEDIYSYRHREGTTGTCPASQEDARMVPEHVVVVVEDNRGMKVAVHARMRHQADVASLCSLQKSAVAEEAVRPR